MAPILIAIGEVQILFHRSLIEHYAIVVLPGTRIKFCIFGSTWIDQDLQGNARPIPLSGHEGGSCREQAPGAIAANGQESNILY